MKNLFEKENHQNQKNFNSIKPKFTTPKRTQPQICFIFYLFFIYSISKKKNPSTENLKRKTKINIKENFILTAHKKNQHKSEK